MIIREADISGYHQLQPEHLEDALLKNVFTRGDWIQIFTNFYGKPSFSLLSRGKKALSTYILILANQKRNNGLQKPAKLKGIISYQNIINFVKSQLIVTLLKKELYILERTF